MKKGILWLVIGLMLLQTACTGKESSTKPTQDVSATSEDPSKSDEQKDTQEESAEDPTGSDETANENGTLKLTMLLQDNYNPLVVSDMYCAQVLGLMFTPLLDFDETGTAYPAFASEWEMASDNRSVTLTVNPDVRWASGTKAKVSDIAYSIRTIWNNSDSAYSNVGEKIADLAILDDDRIQIYFTEASPLNLNLLYFPILSEDYYSGGGRKTSPMGSGPYMLSRYEPMTKLVLRRNPYYFGDRPNIEHVEILLTRSEARLDSFDRGVTNLVYSKDIQWSEYLNKASVTLHTFSTAEMEMLVFNTDKILDPNKRKAVAYAIDAQKILRDTNVDKGDLSEAPISPMRWYGPTNPSRYGQSAEKVTELLDLSQQLTLTLLVNTGDALQQAVAEEIQKELREQGIQVELQADNTASYRSNLASRNFDLALVTISIDSDRDLRKLMQGGTANYAGYTSEAAGEMVDRIGTQTEQQDVHQGFVTISDKLAEDMPYYCLFFKKQAVMTGYGIRGDLHPTEYNLFRGVETLYYSE